MTVPVTSTPSSVATSPAILPSRSARYRRVIEGLHIRDEYGRIKQLKFSESQENRPKGTSGLCDNLFRVAHLHSHDGASWNTLVDFGSGY